MARLLKIFKHIGNYSIAALLINHIKNSIPLWVEFLGMANRVWGMAKKLLSSQCPKGWGEQPRPPTQGN
ncbi:hypothetical protein [Nostoc sp.]